MCVPVQVYRYDQVLRRSTVSIISSNIESNDPPMLSRAPSVPTGAPLVLLSSEISRHTNSRKCSVWPGRLHHTLQPCVVHSKGCKKKRELPCCVSMQCNWYTTVTSTHVYAELHVFTADTVIHTHCHTSHLSHTHTPTATLSSVSATDLYWFND